MIKNLRHVGLVVSDMDRAIKFYQGLGCKVINRCTEDWGLLNLEVCKMTHNIELIKGEEIKNHAAFLVDNWDGLGNRFLTWKERKTKSHWTMFTEDPDGNVIELVKEEK